jgi:hypothetical protein
LVGAGEKGHWAMGSKRFNPIKVGSTGELKGKGRNCVGSFKFWQMVKNKKGWNQIITGQLRILGMYFRQKTLIFL